MVYMTPPHEYCAVDRPLTYGEMLAMITQEGLVGLGDPRDVATAETLARFGFVEVTDDPCSQGEDAVPHIVSTLPHEEFPLEA